MAGTFQKNIGLVKSKTPLQDTKNRDGEVLLTTQISILDQDGYAIGFITGFTPSQNRSTERIRHISHADAGRVIEQAPKPEDVSITVNGFALYNTVDEKGNLAQRLGAWNPRGAFASLQEQQYGFTLIVVEKNPKTGETADVREYQDCWLQTYSKPISVGNATVSDSATIIASRVVRPDNWKSL
jgi:hypothetical protein